MAMAPGKFNATARDSVKDSRIAMEKSGNGLKGKGGGSNSAAEREADSYLSGSGKGASIETGRRGAKYTDDKKFTGKI